MGETEFEKKGKLINSVCGVTILYLGTTLTLRTRIWHQKFGLWGSGILGGVALMQIGLHTSCVQMLDLYEEVDVVTKGGNYGWGVYEGPIPFPSGNGAHNSSATQNLIFPVAGYTHSEINKKIGSAAISGGYFYRSETDPCMSGRYLYGDLYASNIWAATEEPRNSGNFSTAAMPFSCGKDSPIQCDPVPKSTLPALGYIYSFAQDNRKDAFILASSGVYRVVRPSRCNYACSKEIVRPATASPSPSPPPSGAQSMTSHGEWLLLLLSFLILVGLHN